MPFLGPKGLELKPVKTGNDFADAILGLVLSTVKERFSQENLKQYGIGLTRKEEAQRFKDDPMSVMPFLGAGSVAGKKFLPGINKMAKAQFFAAPSDAKPLSDLAKMFPALINEKTGEVMVNMQRGPGGHDSLLKSLQGMSGKVTDWARGFADEVTGFGFTDKQLSKFY